MPLPGARFLIALVMSMTALAVPAAQAQNNSVLQIHNTLDGDRPLLCKDRESVGTVVAILARAIEARGAGDADKAQRLLDIGSRFQAEICRRAVADDIVILRCKIGQQTGTNISVIKLSAVIRTEASKGEQPFFGWTYSGIGDAADTAEAQEATTKWCADQGADEAVNPTPDLVLRVQQRLYDFGLRITLINGQLTAETVQGLIEFQKWAKLPPTGQLTKQTVQRISSMSAPSAWVSFAFNGAGHFGAETGTTRRGAEIEAVKKLQRRSRGGDYKLSSVSAPNCIAFATTGYSERSRRRRTNYTQAFTSAGESAEAASQAVLQFCENEKGGGTCEVRHALCADGGSGAPPERYDRGSPPVNSPAPRFDPKNLPLNSAPPQSR